MNKIIIHHNMSDVQAAYYATEVIKQGKISKEDTQYCYVTRFTSLVTVYASVTRTGVPVFQVMENQE